jgi:hypothetical protein
MQLRGFGSDQERDMLFLGMSFGFRREISVQYTQSHLPLNKANLNLPQQLQHWYCQAECSTEYRCGPFPLLPETPLS